MTSKISAGLLMYRMRAGKLEVFLAHPGGPFYAAKDEGSWTIPKGLVEGEEDALAAAEREFEEETGIVPAGPYVALGSAKQRSGKTVHAWAFRRDEEPPEPLRSNTFEIEWPPRSGRKQAFPEIDRAAFFSADEARRTIIEGQRPFVDRLEQAIAERA